MKSSPVWQMKSNSRQSFENHYKFDYIGDTKNEAKNWNKINKFGGN